MSEKRQINVLPFQTVTAGHNDRPFVVQCNEQTANRQPIAAANIILIQTDDLDAWLATIETMPRVRSLLMDQGVTFANDLSASA